MAYSPDNKYLAVGSHDNRVYVYDVENNYERVSRFNKHSSYIHCLDWSCDS